MSRSDVIVCQSGNGRFSGVWPRRVALALLVALFASAPLCQVSSAQEETTRARDRSEQYIPADQLDVVFERTRNGVMLPKDEFQKLLSQADAARARAAETPAPILIRSADYSVSQQDSHALITLQMQIEQFVDAWQSLEIPVTHLNLEQATIAGNPAAVGRKSADDSTIVLIHRTAGRFTLNLQFSTPLGNVGSDKVVAFGTLPAVASNLTVDCPAGQFVEVNNLQLQRPEPVEAATSYSFPIGSLSEIRLKWTSRSQTAETETLVFARSDIQIRLSQDGLRWASDSRISVFGGSINQVVARVPSSLEITDVQSTGLESWTLEDDPDAAGSTRLLLSYRQPFSNDRLITVTAVSGSGNTIPTLVLNDLTAHTGRIHISHEDQLRLNAEAGAGLRQLSGADVAGMSFNDSVFDFWIQDYQLAVTVRPRDRELFAEVDSSLSFADTMAFLTSTQTIETLNAPLFDLNLSVPADWQLNQVTSPDGVPIPWRASTTENQITVEPVQPVAAGQLLTVVLQFSRSIPDPSTPQQIPLPVVLADDAHVVAGSYQIAAASDLSVAPIELQGLLPVADTNGAMIFTTQGTRFSGQLMIERRVARISTTSEIRLHATARQLTTSGTLTVDVMSGTIRELDLRLPESIDSDPRFEVVSIGQIAGRQDQGVPSSIAIIEQSADDPVDGYRTFHLKFDRRFAGSLVLKTLIQSAREQGDAIAVPTIQTVDAVRQHGLIVAEASPDQRLSVDETEGAFSGLTATDAGLVDPATEETGRRVVLVFRFVQPDYSLSLQETIYSTQTVPSAVAERLHNVSLLTDNGTILRSCRVNLRCVGVQTLRFTLPNPESSFLWSTVLNGEAIEVRRDESAYLVALPSNTDQTAHHLEILFEDSQDTQNTLGMTEQQSVEFSIDTERGQSQSIDVLEQTWEVQYPRDSVLLDYGGGFHPLDELESPGWLQSITSLLVWPSLDRLQNRLTPIVISLMILFVVTTLITRRRWIVLGLLTLCGLFLMVAGALYLASPQERSSARFFNEAMTSSMADSVADYEASGEAYMQDDAPAPTAAPAASIGAFESGFGDRDLAAADVFQEEPAAQMPVPDMPMPQRGAGQLPAAPGLSGYPGNAGAAGGFMGGTNLAIQPNNQLDAVTGGEANSLGLAVPNDQAIDGALAKGLQQQMRGRARLSVRVDLQQPDDYNSATFRSLGSTQDARILDLVVQSENQITGIRWLMALITLLLCWRLRNSSRVTRLTLVVGLLLLAAAAVPLLDNQWQSAADGIVLGAIAGVLLWIAFFLLRCVEHACAYLKARSRQPRITSGSSVAGLLLAAAAICGLDTTATAQDSRPQPDKSLDIVVPYAPDGPALMGDRIFLPREQFLKLYSEAYPDELVEQKPPQASQVTAAFYQSGSLTQIRNEQWSQAFKVRYVIRSYADSATNITLPLQSVAIRSAHLNGTPATLLPLQQVIAPPPIPLEQPAASQQKIVPQQVANVAQSEPVLPAPQSGYMVRVPAKGLHLLDLEFEVPAVVDESVGRITLPLQPVPSGSLQFDLPAKNLAVQVNGRSNTFRRNQDTITVPIASATATRIQWQPETASTSTDIIYHAAVTSALVIDDAGLTALSDIEITCRQGQLAELDVVIPADYAVQQITGDQIAGWNLLSDAALPTVRLLFRSPVDQSAKISLKLFSRQTFSTDRAVVQVPIPVVSGASRDVGTVCVLSGRELQIRSDALSGVNQINPVDAVLPAGTDDSLRRSLAWRYTRHPAQASIRVSRETDSLVVNSLNAVQLEDQRQLWTSYVTADIAGAARRRIDLIVPASFLAMEVEATDLADWYLSKASEENADYQILSIQFQSARSGHVDIVIQGQADRASDHLQPVIATPAVAGATGANTRLSIWLDAASEIAQYSAAGWNSVDPAQIDQRIRALQTDAPDISFTTSNTAPGPVSLNLRQANASLIAESVSVTNVTETAIDLTLALNWQISRAATRQLSFELPEHLADVFDFRIRGLRQLEQSAPQDGKVRITIHLQKPVSEHFFVLGVGTLPLPEDRIVSPQPPQFVTGQGTESTVSIAGQTHFWVIVNQSQGVLEPVRIDDAGNDVDPGQISTEIPEGFLQQSVAIRKLVADRPISPWQLRLPQQQQITPAVIALAEHVTILAEDFTFRSRHTLQVRNDSRQFLPVFLPENSRFLYCLVKGKPARIVTRLVDDSAEDLNRTLYLIPVPQSDAVSAPFEVEFALAGLIDGAAQKRSKWSRKNIAVPAPEFPDFREQPAYGVTVSRNTWSVYVPESLRASLVDNPRETNVVSADQDDFQTSIALSAYDNVKSMMVLSGTARSSRESLQVLNEIQKQRQVITDNLSRLERGKSSQLGELDEATALQEIDKFVQQQQSQAVEPSVQLGTTLQNGYLLEQEALRNTFNDANNSLFFSQNYADGFSKDAAGKQINIQDGKQMKFRFALPEQIIEEKLKSLPDKPETAPEDKSIRDRQSELQKGERELGRKLQSQSRSQLLSRNAAGPDDARRSGRGMAAPESATAAGRPSDQLLFDLPKENLDFNGQLPGLTESLTFGQQTLQSDNEMLFEEAEQLQQVASAGILSLQFELPTDGVRHDFVRTGGNPVLTLSIRSSESVHKGLGLLWAVGCIAAVLVLIRFAKSQISGQLLIGILLLAAVTGIVGSTLFDNPLRSLSLLMCYGSSIALCVIVVVRSFRKPQQA
jgi:hypothetical protein